MVNSLYFIALVITTIGYGDHEGDFTHESTTMIFVTVYVLVGFLLIASLFAVAMDKIIQTQEAYLSRLRGELLEAMTDTDTYAEEKLLVAQRAEHDALRKQVIILALVVAGIAVLGCTFMVYQEDHTWLQSVYWLVITGTTVGFGDVTPKTEMGKW